MSDSPKSSPSCTCGDSKQYNSYRVLEGLFYMRYKHIAQLPDQARRAITDKVYPTVAGFGPDHHIELKDFHDQYGTLISKRTGQEYFH